MADGQVERDLDLWLDEHWELLPSGMKVLDLGCGHGDDSAAMVAHGLNVWSFDRQGGRIDVARQRAPEATFVEGDMRERFPFPDGQFDAVVASLSLHYFDWLTTVGIVSEVGRVLRPEGLLLCRVNRVGDVNFMYGEGEELEPDFFEVEPGRTKRFFTEERLRELLEPRFEIDWIRESTTQRWGKLKRILEAQARRGA